MKLLNELLILSENVNPEASVRLVGDGMDKRFVFDVDGVNYEVTPRAFLRITKNTDGEYFTAYGSDSDGHLSTIPFPVSSNIGQQIVNLLKPDYNLDHLQKGPGDGSYTDQRMRQGENGLNGLNEARLIHTSTNAEKSAKVYFNPEDSEYVVKFFNGGKHNPDEDYFADDKHDAVGTANTYVK